MLSMAGVRTRIIQEVLGHSKGSITHDTYSHALLVGEPQERLRALRRGVLMVSSGGMMLAATTIFLQTDHSTRAWAVLGLNQ